jgi:uncharacterized membrane protein
MTAPHADQIIDGYLARLDLALAGAPEAARADLVAEVTSHIAEARAALMAETDADLLNILDRLGEPAVLALDAVERPDSAPVASAPPTAALTRFPGSAIAAILVLCVGPLIPGMMFPLIGPLVCLIVGLILARMSGVWTDRDVNLAGLVSIVLAALLFLLAAASSGHVLLLTEFVGSSIAVVPSGIFLGLRARTAPLR